MTKAKSSGDVEAVTSLFPPGSAKMIQRVLARAAERELAAVRSGMKAMHGIASSSHVGHGAGVRLATELAKAVRQRGAPKRGAPSIRQKAPDTGGRPFHFAYSVIKKSVPSQSSTGGRARKADVGRAAAHMKYVEREIAVERTPGTALDQDPRNPSNDQGLEDERPLRSRGTTRRDDSWDRQHDETPPMEDGLSSAGGNQGYIENPVKLANGEKVLFSFGNIGMDFGDRVAFWGALEAAEAHPNARVQNRLIVELPHEASPAARFAMLKQFCSKFEADGVPFWAALHAPGPGNDARNYHAHVVYSERPAKRMVDPSDGMEKWDFEVIQTYTTKSRNVRKSRPHRQSKLRAYNAPTFIPELREAFAVAVNTILVRDDIEDAEGIPVRYDARSYKDMGLDTVPMRSINRIIADKLQKGARTVLDGDYTRKMVAAEIQRAASRRDKQVLELMALDEALEEVARRPARAAAVNPRLPKAMRVSPLAPTNPPAMRTAVRRILELRHAALGLDVMERATKASLERIVEATAPAAVAAAAKVRDLVERAEAPDPEIAAILHAAALEELASTRTEVDAARRTLTLRGAAALQAWQALVAPANYARSPRRKRMLAESPEATPTSVGRQINAASTSRGEAMSSAPARGGDNVQRAQEDTSVRPTPATAPTARPSATPTPAPAHAMAPPATRRRTLIEGLGDERATERDGQNLAGPPGKAMRPGPTDAQQTTGLPIMPVMPVMPTMPSMGRLAAISAGASAYIKAIAASTANVDERMAILRGWTDRPMEARNPKSIYKPEFVTSSETDVLAAPGSFPQEGQGTGPETGQQAKHAATATVSTRPSQEAARHTADAARAAALSQQRDSATRGVTSAAPATTIEGPETTPPVAAADSLSFSASALPRAAPAAPTSQVPRPSAGAALPISAPGGVPHTAPLDGAVEGPVSGKPTSAPSSQDHPGRRPAPTELDPFDDGGASGSPTRSTLEHPTSAHRSATSGPPPREALKPNIGAPATLPAGERQEAADAAAVAVEPADESEKQAAAERLRLLEQAEEKRKKKRKAVLAKRRDRGRGL